MRPQVADWLRTRAGLALVLGAVAFFSVALYLPTIEYDFVWDDTSLISENELLYESGPWEVFTRPYWAGAPDGPEGTAESYYRPLVNLSFWGDARLSGTNPGWFHLVNTVLHTLVSVLVALIVWQLLNSGIWAGLAGMFFAAHSSHVESVAFISGRTDLMMALFLGIAAFGLLRSLRKRQHFWLVLVPLGYAGALLSKETALLFPVVVALAPLLTQTSYSKRYWAAVGVTAAVGVGYLFLRTGVVGAALPNPNIGSVVGRLLEVTNTFGLYIRMFIWPFSHHAKFPLDPQFAHLTPATIVALLYVVSVPLLAIRRRFLVSLWGYVWTVLFLLPVTNIVALGPQAAERLLYLPSAGLVMAGVALLARLFRSTRRLRVAVGVLMLAATAALAVDTVFRSNVWRNEKKLYSTMVREAPRSPSAHANLANVLRETFPDSALGLYDRAISLDQGHVRAHVNAGILRSRMGDHRQGIHHLRIANELEPGSAKVLSNIGLAFLTSGRPESARVYLEQALEVDPGSAPVRVNYAAVLDALGDGEGADRELRRTLEGAPGFAPALVGLADRFERNGMLDSAIVSLDRASRLVPSNPVIANRLGTMHVVAGDSTEAERSYRRALSADSMFVPALFNQAVLLAARGDTTGARRLALRAVRARPDVPAIVDLYRQLSGEPGN